ncbi:MAG: hypothetical protein LBC03_02905 [Nitrososphaerota archaeon]|jgi:hypothetical protein|nr:hypothetical protein [Nitrososphaerota archaeon]
MREPVKDVLKRRDDAIRKAMIEKLFTGKTKTYNKVILKALFHYKKLTSAELGKKICGVSVPETIEEKKKLKATTDNLTGVNGKLKDLERKGFILNLSTKKVGEHRNRGEADRYTLTDNKGRYTALMLLNEKEISELTLSDFPTTSLFDEFYLFNILLEDISLTDELYHRIRDSFNKLQKNGYDLLNMSNVRFNELVTFYWDSFLNDLLISAGAPEKLNRLSKEDYELYLKFLIGCAEGYDQLMEQSLQEASNYAKQIDLINTQQKKIKKLMDEKKEV